MKVSALRSCALTCLLLTGGALGANQPDIVQFHRDIHVESGQSAGDISCIGCSVYVRGQVAGDVAVLLGKLVISPSASVAGNVAVIAGDLAGGDASSIGGDVAVIGGRFRRPPDMRVNGNVAVMEGRGWFYLMVFAPLLGLVFLVALIVWMVQLVRRRSRTPSPAYNRPA